MVPRLALIGMLTVSLFGFAGSVAAASAIKIKCKGIEDVLPAYLRSSPEHLVATVPLTMKDGIVAVRYPEPRGLQINPFNVASYGLLQAMAYCKDRKDERLATIRNHYEWLIRHLDRRQTKRGRFFRVISYDFPDEPWVSRSGWPSALSQAAGLAFLDRVRIPGVSRKIVREFATAFIVHIKDGGIYSRFGRHGIIWQEVANPGKPSDIINGHAAAVYIVSHELEKLSGFPKLQARLARMAMQGRRSIVSMLPFMVPEEGKILYDFHGIGTRTKDDYSYHLIVSVLDWMRLTGDVSNHEFRRISDLRKYEGPKVRRPKDN